MRSSTLRSTLGLVLVTFGGCNAFVDYDPDLAGDYRTVSFTITEDGQTTDLHTQGASLTLELGAPAEARGPFRGRLVAPDLDGTGATDESFDGQHVTVGRTLFDGTRNAEAVLNFETEADGFGGTLLARDVAWYFLDDSLSTTLPQGPGEGGGEITVVLVRE